MAAVIHGKRCSFGKLRTRVYFYVGRESCFAHLRCMEPVSISYVSHLFTLAFKSPKIVIATMVLMSFHLLYRFEDS